MVERAAAAPQIVGFCFAPDARLWHDDAVPRRHTTTSDEGTVMAKKKSTVAKVKSSVKKAANRVAKALGMGGTKKKSVKKKGGAKKTVAKRK
jgi:hypothetical protein